MEYVFAILLIIILYTLREIKYALKDLNEHTWQTHLLLKEMEEEVASFRLIVKYRIEKDEKSIHRAFEP